MTTLDRPVPATATAPAPTPAPPARQRPAAGFDLAAAVRVSAAALAALAVWFVAYATVISSMQEHSDQARLYARIRGGLAAATVPVVPPIAAGAPVALIDIPHAGVRPTVVVEGTTSVETAKGPGHLASTPLPGQVGTSVIFGRSLTFGAPFGNLERLQKGDPIHVTTQQGTFTYRVIDRRAPHDPLPAPPEAGAARLVLVTSAATGWQQGWAPDHAVYVDATLVSGQAQAVPRPRVVVAPSAAPMRSDSGALVSVVLWLEALLLAAAASAWAWARWTTWQTWLIGAPLVVASLWAATSAATLLLPNLV